MEIIVKKIVDGQLKKSSATILQKINLSYSKTKYKDLNGTWRDRIYDNQFMIAVEGGYITYGDLKEKIRLDLL
jgi:hypothetical protein